jgi:hypothetical protein
MSFPMQQQVRQLQELQLQQPVMRMLVMSFRLQLELQLVQLQQQQVERMTILQCLNCRWQRRGLQLL